MSVQNMDNIPLVTPTKKHPGQKRAAELQNIIHEVDFNLEKAARYIRGCVEADSMAGSYDQHTATFGSLNAPLYVVRSALQAVAELLEAVRGQMPEDAT